ncbi:hypothetical protein AHAS_Ahas16G0198300 [Arachis hypogaea]
MTTILTEMHKEQKAFYSIQAIQALPQVAQLAGPPRICDSNRAITQEQERLKGVVEKHEAQFGTITAQLSNIQELLSRMALPSSNNSNQPSNSSNLPSQPLPNPKDGLNAITLRSGTTLEEIPPRVIEDIHEEEVVVEAPNEEEEVDKRHEEEEASLKKSKRKAKKTPEFDLNILQVFKKVEDRIGELETLSLGSSISSLMKPIPEKCGDPGPCLVSCHIGGRTFHDCMCDLGTCVSIMLLSIFIWLNLAPLKKSVAKFALDDKSVITMMGIAEDVLVAIKDLVFPVNFYILEMPPTENKSASSVLLGRPFLKTSKFKLDAFTDTYFF